MNKSLIKVRFKFIENKRLTEKYSYLLQTIVQNLFCISVCFFICYNKRIFAGGDARQVAKKGEKEGRSADQGSDGSDCRRVSQEWVLRGDNCAENGGQPHNAEPSVSEENRLVTRTVSAGISAAAVRKAAADGDDGQTDGAVVRI